MKTKYNRFAIVPVFCMKCRHYIWLEKYRKDYAVTGIADPPLVRQNICKECLSKE